MRAIIKKPQCRVWLLWACLSSVLATPAWADIVIRDVLDPPPTIWPWGSGDILITDSVCIGTDQPGFFARLYRITATGSGSGGSFFLQGPAPLNNDVLSYTVQWNSQAGQNVGTNLTAGVPQIAIMIPKLDLNCSPSPGVNASVIVIIPQTDLLNAPAGDYSGILYLTVAPW